MTYDPAEHRQNTGYISPIKYIGIFSKNSLYSIINKIYVTEVRYNTFWPSQLKADHLGEFNFSHFTKIWKTQNN